MHMTDPHQQPSHIRSLRWLVPLLAMALVFAAAPTVAHAGKKWVLRGHGYGHGIGMSQWGAYGYAQHGTDYRKIISHYYQGTKIEKVRASRSIRVLLATTSGSASFSGAKRACGHDLHPSSTYYAALSGGKVRLQRGNGKRIAGCGSTLVAKGVAGPIQIGGQGSFRGNFVAVASGGDLYLVNQVSLDDYVQGVIPNEMPSSWPLDALQAQAVAARSYALATDAGGDIFDQYDDTRSQVYGGLSTETGPTNKAVRKSKQQVVTYGGNVIPAFFFSSSGGRTENVEFGFPGAVPVPYLKSVRDPYDDASSNHRWKETFTQSQMQSKLGALVKGRLKKIDVTKRGVSPRIVLADLVGSKGTTKVTGADLRLQLGLRSTWVKFKH